VSGPRALLLDLDGTLVDSEPFHRRSYDVFLERRGWTVPDVRIFTGRRAEDVFAEEPGPWSGEDPEALAAEVRGIVDEMGTPGPVTGAHGVVLSGNVVQVVVGPEADNLAADIEDLM
jgi:sugar-phosphatase